MSCSPLPKGSATAPLAWWAAPGAAIVSEETVITPELGETIQAHFVRCIRDGLTPKVTGHDARAVLAIVLAIQESSRTGEAIPLQTATH